jgi:hypothetical protein
MPPVDSVCHSTAHGGTETRRRAIEPSVGEGRLRALSRIITALSSLVRVPELAQNYSVKRMPVESSVLLSIGFDSKNEVLEVEFISGAIYRYTDVPEKEYRDLMEAKSLGSYFNGHIKDDYRYTRIR